MERIQQRQKVRDYLGATGCTSSFVLPLPTLGGPDRRVFSCGETGLTGKVLPFISPTGCPPTYPAITPNPDGLIVGNTATTAYCPTASGYGLTGTTSVYIGPFDQQIQIFFQTLTGVSNSQLTYLFSSVPSTSGSIISAALASNTGAVKSITKLGDTQVNELIPLIQDAQINADALAVDKARNSLACAAYNFVQYAYCPTGAFTGSSASVPSDLPYNPSSVSATGSFVVSFSVLSSTGSQSEFSTLNIPGLTAAALSANTLAQAAAEQSLACLYTNDTQWVTCCNTAAGGSASNLGYNSCVPNDVLPVLPDLAPRVGSTGLLLDSIFSSISKTEANELALSISYSSLNCYFPNEDTTAVCPTAGVASSYPINFTAQASWGATTGDYLLLDNSDGLINVNELPLNTRLIISAGSAPTGATAGNIYYVSSSTAINPSVVGVKLSYNVITHQQYETDSIPVLSLTGSGAGSSASLMQSNFSGKYAYILRGEIIESDITSSTGTATTSALSIANSYLDCYWVNAATSATCPAVSFTGINNIGYTLQASSTASVAYNVTVDAGTIISYSSQTDADLQAIEMANNSLACSYCNARVDPTCVPYSPSGGWTDSYLPIPNSEFVANCWSINATPGIPSSTICDYSAEAAQNTAISVSNIAMPNSAVDEDRCCYESMPVYNTILCSTGAVRGVTGLDSKDNFFLPSGTIIICATGPSGPTAQYPGSTGYFCGVPGDSGAYFSEKQIEANDIAQNLVNSFVVCYYRNDEQTYSSCAFGLTFLQSGIVPAGSIVSTISKSDADGIAYTLAQALTVCIDPDVISDSVCGRSIADTRSVTIAGQEVSLTLGGDVCNPTITGAVTTENSKLIRGTAGAIKKLTICTGSSTEEWLLPDFSDGDINEGDTIRFLTGYSSDFPDGYDFYFPYIPV